MEEITIYKFQLEVILEVLRLDSQNRQEGSLLEKWTKPTLTRHPPETCYDRQLKQAKKYAENALEGKKDEKVNYGQ